MLKAILDFIRGEQNLTRLKKRGLIVGKNFKRQFGCIIDHSHCWLIKIGNNVSLAPRVHILAHDASTKQYLNYTKIGLVSIGDNTFIGAGSIILPNVSIGKNCIIGAGSVVTCDVPDNTVYAGSPARFICSLDSFIERNKKRMKKGPIFDSSWTLRNKNLTSKQKQAMAKSLKGKIGFIE